jgi:gliding motility-associated-like protein
MLSDRIKYPALFLFCMLCTGGFAQSVGGTTSGAATYCSFTNSGFISVSGYNGTILFWQSSTNGGISWTSNGNTTANQSYFNLTQTTCFRAVVQATGFPADTSSVSCVTIYQPTAGGTISGGGTFCVTGSGTLTLSGNVGGVLNWQYSTNGGSTWTNVVNTSTTLTYTNITQNTLFEAVVQNSSFCPIDTSSRDSVKLDVPTVAGTLTLAGKDSVCFALNSGTLTLSGNNGTVLGWVSSTNSGATWTGITNTSTTLTFSNLLQNTMYAAVVQNGVCPADTTAGDSITVLPLPFVNAGPDSTISPGQSLTLTGSGAGTPFWFPSTGLSSPVTFTPVATPSLTTNYVLVVTDVYSCMNADTVTITVSNPTFNGMISSFFTPNGDGINDTWYIQNIQSFPGNEVFVYNIYGQQVYSKKDYANDWKGTYNGADLPDGTYYYILKLSNNTTRRGSVDILRGK